MLATVHDTVLKLDPRLLQLGSGVLIPLVVGYLTHLHASSKLKSILNFILSAIAGGLSVALASNGTVLLSTWVFGILSTFITSIVTYYGLWRPTGVAGSVQTSGLSLGAPASDTSAQSGTGSRDDILPGVPTTDDSVPEPVDAEVKPAKTVAAVKKSTSKSKSKPKGAR